MREASIRRCTTKMEVWLGIKISAQFYPYRKMGGGGKEEFPYSVPFWKLLTIIGPTTDITHRFVVSTRYQLLYKAHRKSVICYTMLIGRVSFAIQCSQVKRQLHLMMPNLTSWYEWALYSIVCYFHHYNIIASKIRYILIDIIIFFLI